MRRVGLVLLAVGCAHAPGSFSGEVPRADWVVAEGQGGRREVLLRSELERQVELGLRPRPPKEGNGLERFGIDDQVELRTGEVKSFRLLDSQAAAVGSRGEVARIYWSLPVDHPLQTTEGIEHRRWSDLHLEALRPGTQELVLRPSNGPERRVKIKVER